jgi:hypothetical protein
MVSKHRKRTGGKQRRATNRHQRRDGTLSKEIERTLKSVAMTFTVDRDAGLAQEAGAWGSTGVSRTGSNDDHTREGAAPPAADDSDHRKR